MWRTIKIFCIGGFFGTVFGIAVGFFAFPYVFPPPPANEKLSRTEASQLLARGTFIHANPSDPIHYGKGAISLYQRTVFLEKDFEVGPGPKYHVYLVPKAKVRGASDVTGAMFIDLGRLRAFKGSQKYPVPPGVDLAKYPSVVIWCEQFNVLISPADLKFQGS